MKLGKVQGAGEEDAEFSIPSIPTGADWEALREACRPWLTAELAVIAPKIVVAMGATACQSLFGGPIKVLQSRGAVLDNLMGFKTLVTVHPSSLLRMPDRTDYERQFELFVKDLREIRNW